MTSEQFIELLKLHYSNDKVGFDNKLKSIIEPFASLNENLYEKLINIINENTNITTNLDKFNEKIEEFYIPTSFEKQIKMLLNSFKNNITNKLSLRSVLFYGGPGTGKTTLAKKLALVSRREYKSLNFSQIVNYKLGETIKNLERFFENVNEGEIIIIDEIDELITSRLNSDLDEMKRVITTFNKEIDKLGNKVFLIATTNLKNVIDESSLRRFDLLINFDLYDFNTLNLICENYFHYLISDKDEINFNKTYFDVLSNYKKFLKLGYSLDKTMFSPDFIRKSLKISLLSFEENYNPYFELRKKIMNYWNKEEEKEDEENFIKFLFEEKNVSKTNIAKLMYGYSNAETNRKIEKYLRQKAGN